MLAEEKSCDGEDHDSSTNQRCRMEVYHVQASEILMQDRDNISITLNCI